MKSPSIEATAPGEYRADYAVSVASSPFLADHCFQEMIVVPGAFLISIAAELHNQLFRRPVHIISNIRFLSPVILGEGETGIRVQAKKNSGFVTYSFSGQESSADNFATMEIRSDTLSSGNDEELKVAEWQEQSGEPLSAEQFYETLRTRGNQYGPSFRRVAGVWRRGNEVLGRIVADDDVYETPSGPLSPTVLDSVTQLVSACNAEDCRGFLLRSIESIEFTTGSDPEFLWARCRQRHGGHEKQATGDIDLFDHREKVWARLHGVVIERVECARDEESVQLVVASNFTAEPVEDSLRFWADHFGISVDVRFAPYNQVFQQLLDPQSALHKNRKGVNLILLSIEEWAERSRRTALHRDRAKAEEHLAGHKRYFLPNGLEIAHLNSYETDYVYGEIFEDACYLRHGIQLPDNATVIDIGANIGLFTLFVLDQCESPTIYALEPAPATYAVLEANCSLYGSSVKTFNVGVAGEKGRAPFTFYERSSVFSGFHSDQQQDTEAIEAVVQNVLKSASLGEEVTADYVHELSAHRADSITIDCPLTTVSHIIRENQIEHIDVLKIDAEKSELEILRGIQEGDWKKIRQIVMEIHDVTGTRVEAIRKLLGERGYQTAVEEEKLLKKSGLVNLYAARELATEAGQEQPAPSSTTGELERNLTDFAEALQTFRKNSPAPLLVCLCPFSQNEDNQPGSEETEERLKGMITRLGNISVITSSTLLEQYPVANLHDSFTHQAGHVPYTPEGYAAIGTAAVRALTNLTRNPYKVIVLDCDNTLWQGVCGEEGEAGVAISDGHRGLQDFALSQMRAGMLLCLCSKNEEQDVVAVLDHREDMLIRREHLASWRINWHPKSDNIRSLARELNLGLESFIFIDDNPVECAEVQSNCPDVLTLQLPADPCQYPSFLKNLWVFDRTGSTSEDENRTQMYQENAERERFREKTLSLADFIAGLQLRITVAEATEEDISRISQLTFRTNQFNFTTVRRSEGEVRAFLQRPGTKCLVVRVADRFGDYGLVGVVMYEVGDDLLSIDTFLLSCRVLGRGVEHAIMRDVGQRASAAGVAAVQLRYVRTPKNTPALAFALSLGVSGSADSSAWRLSPDALLGIEYQAQNQSMVSAETVPPKKPASAPREGFSYLSDNGRVQEVANRLCDVNQIVLAIERHRGEKLSAQAQPLSAGSMETMLREIWRRVLGHSSIGKNENFFDAGGTSLKAVQLVALIRKELRQTLPIAAVFEYPTLALMAQKLGARDEKDVTGEAAAAMRRGQQRRYRTMRNAG